MNKRVLVAVLTASVATLTGCNNGVSTSGGGSIGLVDVGRITSNWPKFVNYQNQLNADAQTVEASHSSNADKAREMAQLNAQFQTHQTELTNDVRAAAQQVATDKHLKFVFTQQFVGYGGVDITSDVEKALNITERATPAP
jgi:Skp family chaperone for outer membrane proteins